MDPLMCPADCGKTFLTSQAVASHLTQAQSCKWYCTFQKTTAIKQFSLTVEQEDLGDDMMRREDEGDIEGDVQQVAEMLQEFEEENDVFHFIRVVEEPAVGVAGPGPATQAHRDRLSERQLGGKVRSLDDGDLSLIEVKHQTGGALICMDTSLHEQWRIAHNLPVDIEMDGSSTAPHTLYAPFASEMDWRIAEWVVKDNIGHNSFNRLLQIPGVVEKLGLSYTNITGLHKSVDSICPKAGEWKVRRLCFKDRPDEEFILHHRNVLEVVQSLWGDPSLAKHLVYRPKSVFQDEAKKHRTYSEMWTGKWWQKTQDRLPKGATIAPLIVATNKTQLTQFSGSKQAYPVYATLGNIPQSLRRKPSQQACVLLAYLPVQKMNKQGLAKREVSGRYQHLFHDAMRHILFPLVAAGRDGVEMASADGQVRCVHSILAVYVADFPEQCMVACCKYGTCPKCQTSAANLADKDPAAPRTNAWTLGVMQEARETTTSYAQYFVSCMRQNVSGYTYRPFWEDLPYCDIHFSISPDILHQLYQGVLKHLIAWCQDILSESELDRRIRSLPPAYGVRHFKNGISTLSQISGMERKNMGKILLGCLVGSTIPKQGITAVRAILDFIYLAQYTLHDDATLSYMEKALDTWHANKSFFITVGVHNTLNIPKFHSLHQYVQSIRFLGTTDNYNTEMFEHLHIDFAKKGWRASNKREEFPQMTCWLSRQENIHSFNRELSWILEQRSLVNNASQSPLLPSPTLLPPPRILLPKVPTSPNKSITSITQSHRVPMFSSNLKRYLEMLKPDATPAHVPWALVQSLPFDKLDVYHSFKFASERLEEAVDLKDVVKASPLDDGRFDTVVVLTGDAAEAVSLTGTRIGRVKVIFRLPSHVKLIGSYKTEAPRIWPRTSLAYIEWYTTPTLTVSECDSDNIATVNKSQPQADGSPQWSIIPLTNIRQSCMLFPNFRKIPASVQSSLTSSNILDTATSFFVNNWSSLYTYKTIYKD